MTTASRPHRYSAQLDRDWNRFRFQRHNLDHVRSWATGDDPFDRCVLTTTDLEQLVDLTHRREVRTGAGNDALVRLVALARTDDVAARIVLRRLMGGLIVTAMRHRNRRDHLDPAEIIVGSAWIAIKSFDMNRRHGHVAAALVSDARDRAFRRPQRLRSATEEPCGGTAHFDAIPVESVDTPIVELAAAVGEARRAGVADHHIELLCQLARTPLPGMVARERCITPRGMRNQRDRAVAEVRAAVLAA